ncbi:hypothetical protein MLD38_031370 [Melastoma candidum]|uniref:Uncharacterized protein n=1 Tax=Melastoma candidum TaxID=119954 RepID=A0ACB9MR14_9MYRT|nr:hypothetical protein MLD38_031370 [Melastoma candidum]
MLFFLHPQPHVNWQYSPPKRFGFDLPGGVAKFSVKLWFLSVCWNISPQLSPDILVEYSPGSCPCASIICPRAHIYVKGLAKNLHQWHRLLHQAVGSPGVASGDGSAVASHADHLLHLKCLHKSRQAGTAAFVCPCNNSRCHQDSRRPRWCLRTIRTQGRTMAGAAAAAAALVAALLASPAAIASDHALRGLISLNS